MSIARNKPPKRMNAKDRKQAILRAAAPVLARRGFRGTSVRDIASAAGVSEALLYKHFANKRALYDEAAAEARRSSRFTITRFVTLEPGTESFVLLTYATVTFIMFGFPGRTSHDPGTQRLVFRSLLGDGRYARAVFADTAAEWMGYVVESFEAAVASGDVVEMPIEPSHRFRFVQQLAMALRLSHLPDRPAFDYSGSKRCLANQAVLFSLRGLGLTDRALAKYFDPKRLQSSLDALFAQTPS